MSKRGFPLYVFSMIFTLLQGSDNTASKSEFDLLSFPSYPLSPSDSSAAILVSFQTAESANSNHS